MEKDGRRDTMKKYVKSLFLNLKEKATDREGQRIGSELGRPQMHNNHKEEKMYSLFRFGFFRLKFNIIA